MASEFTRGETYEATVTSADDGDTLNVTFDEATEELRVIGVDTPETAANQQFERSQEWEGITDLDYLAEWGARASRFAEEELVGKAVTVAFDPNEPIRDEFDRLLTYVTYERGETGNGDDGDESDGGDGSGNGGRRRATLYNRLLIEEGYARVYDSGFERHDELWRVERDARANGRGVWAESDIESVPEVRDRPVAELFFPQAARVETVSGPIGGRRVPVVAETSATRSERDESADRIRNESAGEGSSLGETDDESGSNGSAGGDGIALVGFDRSSNLVLVGGLLVDETYEFEEDFRVDTSEFGNFPLVTNCISLLTERSGDVLIDGGHGQFDAEYALSAEDAAYYKRYLEGQDIGFEQNNTLSSGFLDRGRALLVTTPAEPFTDEESALLADFAGSGGAIVLLGSANAPASARTHLNDLASALGSDLRLGAGVRDEERNLDGDPRVPVTSAFDDSFPLFSAYTPSGTDPDPTPDPGPVPDPGPAPDPSPGPDDPTGRLAVVEVTADAPGAERENLAAETITFENRGRRSLSLSGWTVADEANHVYEFPDGFELAPGERVTLHTGAGTDSERDLFWGAGSPVWNNAGDTITVRDGEGSVRVRELY